MLFANKEFIHSFIHSFIHIRCCVTDYTILIKQILFTVKFLFEMSLRSSEAAKGVIDYMILIKQIVFTVKFLFEMSLRSSEAANDLGNILQDSSLSPKLLMVSRFNDLQ